MELSVILFGLKAMLPAIGTMVYQIPKVRRYTRWIVTAFASVQSYIILLGLPPVEPTVPGAIEGAAIFGGIAWLWANPITQAGASLVWGFVDGWVSQQIHRSQKYRKIVKGA
ncbi:MAG TPA: hypothetical protein VMX94_02695 [Armatimonadota bacterium]|nr:hypothetical protein [Armatimonadota bacterium]